MSTRRTTSRQAVPYVLLLALLAGLMAAYFVLRYQGRWAEHDTTSLTLAIENVARAGRLVPQSGVLYGNGFSYQALVLFLAQASGVPPAELQRLALPFAVIGIPLVFWMLLRELSGSAPAATAGALLLLLQPELQFVVLRGSHEKVGRLLMILSFFLLFRSLRQHDSVKKTGVFIFLFYLVIFAFLASNFFMGFSFIAAVGFALAASWGLSWAFPRKFRPVASNQKLLLITLAILILAYLIAFYAYPPVQNIFAAAEVALQKLRLLLLSVDTSSTVYQNAFDAWGSPLVYLTFNLANWVVLLGSFVLWVTMGTRWLRSKTALGDENLVQWVLWLLYGAFGFQAFLAVASDASGAFGNLQHRIFPSLSILGVMLIGTWLAETRVSKRSVQVLTACGVMILAVLSILKFTNEPALVGWWVFYTPAEAASLEWSGENLNRTSLWTGYNERLFEINRQEGFIDRNQTNVRFGQVPEPGRYVLVSEAIRAQGAQLNLVLPDQTQTMLVYDNGGARIYKDRPTSPFQR